MPGQQGKAMKLVAGCRQVLVALADIEKHPDSLLHSLAAVRGSDGAEAAEQPVTVQLLGGGFASSPLTSWPEALNITADIYK